ncbi:phosphonate ABC transporter ATP-binding protein [Saccharospirillum sp. MSK14-1]|uniref:ATP-binding cassette domain-containing protein n=1 Tax=Saccharospirillum sp. MSK14-1 TaxID=1897632 RepID=UPI000D3A2387|nr:ATP-binding cassette domain-containing protein [Saccharospirillum sp. MSK14-1]PTY37264.1 phosphonate ABC transporter ATP-binding protein [Saccharospirillum sp. MSK14-1]
MNSTAPLFNVNQAELSLGGRVILRDLNLQIHSGERVALLGESGSGKTTLLRSLRQQHPAEVAWCPQQASLVPLLSVFHNLYMGRLDQYHTLYNLRNLVWPAAERRREVSAWAERLGLEGRLNYSVDRLSGGQQSRVNLGRALYQQRPVFIGDEPVSAVDEHQADDLLRLIIERHTTVILALHNIEQALTHCQRIIGLKDGRVILDAPSRELKAADLAALYPAAV